MKKLIILTAVFLTYFVSTTNASGFGFGIRFHHRYGYINDNYFFNALEPYGEWIEIGYNKYAWKPYDVNYNWKPYSIGRWEWTRSGWYWVSYEPFGWATYHYGRWYYDDYYGWVWIPGYKWAPAWVEWRYNDYYIGWAPLPPFARFNSYSGISFSVRWNSDYNYWNFVTYRNFNSVNINNYCINNFEIRNVFNRTKYRTNYFERNNSIINGGISKRFIERRSGTTIRTKEIRRINSFSNMNKLSKKNRREVFSYRPSKTEVRKIRTFNKRKIKKGKAIKWLTHSKTTVGNGREINKTNRLELKRNRKIFRKNNAKRYKPLVKKNVRPNKTYTNGRKRLHNKTSNMKSFGKFNRKEKSISKMRVHERSSNTKRYSGMNRYSGKRKSSFSKSENEGVKIVRKKVIKK